MRPLLTMVDVARLLNRNPATLKSDLLRNPRAVPPRVHLPGTRLLRWREADVEAWLCAHTVSVVPQKGGEDE